MWYENSVLMSFIGVVIGAIIGFVGAIIQSSISAKNNISIINLQSKKENEQRRYIEKELLYSDIIKTLPQIVYHYEAGTNKFKVSNETTLLYNTFKARLKIYSTPTIHDKFFEMMECFGKNGAYEFRVKKIEELTEILISDLKNFAEYK